MVALNDISTLAQELGRGGSVGAALERYQARRYAFVRARALLVDALYELFRRDDAGARTLRRGLSRYWRSGKRARSASLSLLSGRESRVSFLLGEYLAVMLSSARDVLGTSHAVSVNGERRTAATELVRASLQQLTHAATTVYADMRRQRRATRPSAAPTTS